MKQKTKKAAVKRFKILKSGKILRGRQLSGHLKSNKSHSAKSRYKKTAYVSKPETRTISRLIPYGSN